MKSKSLSFLRKRHLISGTIVAVALIITPHLKRLAYLERGFEAVGGEYAPLAASFIAALWIMQSLGRMEKNYIRKHHDEGGHVNENMQPLRQETNGPELHISRVREGLCFEAGEDSRVFVNFKKKGTVKGFSGSTVCAITVVKNREETK